MIKFFRNIRQKLITENQTVIKNTNYFKYAIGEIVLVVIGILIALQINNWNEQRKLKQNDLILCKELLNDALADSVFFQSRRVRLEEFKSTAHYILEKPELRTPDSTILAIVAEVKGIFEYSGLRYLSHVVNNGKNNIQEYQSKSVINALRRYKLQYDYVAAAFQRMNSMIENELNPFQKKYMREFMDMEHTHDLNALNAIYDDKEVQESVYLLNGYFDDALNHLTVFQDNNRELINALKERINKGP